MNFFRILSFGILIFAGLLALGGVVIGIFSTKEDLTPLDVFRPTIIILSVYVIGSVLEKVTKALKQNN